MPSTRLPYWAAGFGVAFVAMFAINMLVFMPPWLPQEFKQTYLPFYGVAMMAVGITAGIVSLVAIVKNHEHSWVAVIPLLPGLFALTFILGELLLPH